MNVIKTSAPKTHYSTPYFLANKFEILKSIRPLFLITLNSCRIVFWSYFFFGNRVTVIIVKKEIKKKN